MRSFHSGNQPPDQQRPARVQVLLRESANLCGDELDKHQRDAIDERLKAAEQLLARDVDTIRAASAELNGILAIYQDQIGHGRHDFHILLATDTEQGKETAKLVKGYLNRSGIACHVPVFPSLSTRSHAHFSTGIKNVIRWCDETLLGYRDQGYRIVFNLVGGFKSLQGYMNTIGMFYADEIVYLFEGTKDLIRILVFQSRSPSAVLPIIPRYSH